MTDTRFFSSTQRKELFLRANKKCQMCGVPISLDNFHADHITPYVLGGPTTLANGQAVCPSCNYRKSSSMHVNYEPFVPVGKSLRDWQKDFLSRCYIAMVRQLALPPSEIKAFILMAFPGAGKTLAQVLMAQVLLDQKFIDKVIFCVPSEPLRKQMVEDALKTGLRLTRSSTFNLQNYDGLVTTYQTIASFNSSCKKFLHAESIRSICEDKKVLVIADECHHLSGEKSWGDSFQIAFSNTVARLMTSGTPFRTDGKAIPWVEYHEKKLILEPPYAYAYDYGYCKANETQCALGDKVVRDVVIHAKDIEITFKVGHKKNGVIEEKLYTHRLSDNIDAIPEYQCTFDEDGKRIDDKRALRRQIRSKRREACLECGTTSFPHGTEYVSSVLRDANDQLNLVREDHPWASGLIVCKDKKHADAVAEALLYWTGESSLVVYSGRGNGSNESEQIRNFKNNTTPSRLKWIIAVGMISEGVNIPHLRVGVYLTNIQAAMNWTQILGRVLRVENGIPYDKQTAHFFQYDDGVVTGVDEDGNECNESTGIKLYAENLLKEREAYIKTSKEQTRTGDTEGTKGDVSTVEAISTSDLQSDQIYGGERFEQKTVERFERLAVKTGMAPAKLAYLVEIGGKEDWMMALN